MDIIQQKQVQSDYNPNNNGFNQDKLKTQSMGRDSQARLATQSTDLGTQPTIQVNNVQAPHNQDYQNMNAPNQVQIQQNQQQPVNYLAPQLQHQNSLQMRQQQQQMQYQNQYQQFQNSDNAQVPGMQNYPIPQYSQQKAFMANRNQNHLANQQPARYKKPNNFSYFNENPLHKAPWNERFFVTSVLNNAIPNNFFREFFDKPQRQRIDTMIQPDKPEIPIEEFYRSSSLSQLLFDSAEKKQSRNNESARGTFRQSLGSRLGKRSSTQSASISRGQLRRAQSQKNLLVAEFNWDEKFNIMASKNNIQVHKNYQEYFDKPIEYDARGYAYSRKQEPLRVYDPKTPIMRSPFYMSTKRKREVSEILQNYEATKRFATPPIMYRTGTDYRNKPVTASSTFTNKRMLSTASTNKGSRNSDKNMRLQKTGWSERIGLPISTYNQTVFPRYKILFDHL
eukprot:403343983